jgi:hypothetical protein
MRIFGNCFSRADLSIIRDFTVVACSRLPLARRAFIQPGQGICILPAGLNTPVWINVQPTYPHCPEQRYMKVLHDMFSKRKRIKQRNDLTISMRIVPVLLFSQVVRKKISAISSRRLTTSHNNASSTKMLVDTNPYFHTPSSKVDVNRRCSRARKHKDTYPVGGTSGASL